MGEAGGKRGKERRGRDKMAGKSGGYVGREKRGGEGKKGGTDGSRRREKWRRARDGMKRGNFEER